MSVKSKKDKIKEEIGNSFKKPLSNSESGEIYADFVLLYMQSVNDINRRYARLLDSAIGILKDFKKTEESLTKIK